jgi:hypothetical protein
MMSDAELWPWGILKFFSSNTQYHFPSLPSVPFMSPTPFSAFLQEREAMIRHLF